MNLIDEDSKEVDAIRVDDYDPYDYYDECWLCGGYGYVDGSVLEFEYDYGWIDPNKIYKCPCCGGSGEAKDCTYW